MDAWSSRQAHNWKKNREKLDLVLGAVDEGEAGRSSAAIFLFFHTDRHPLSLFALFLFHLVLSMRIQTWPFSSSQSAPNSHRTWRYGRHISHNVKNPTRDVSDTAHTHSNMFEWKNPGSCYLCTCSAIHKTNSNPLKPSRLRAACPAEGPSSLECANRMDGVLNLRGTSGKWLMSTDGPPHEYQAPSTCTVSFT